MADEPVTEIACPMDQRARVQKTGGPVHWRDDGTCSYCGSVAPDAFMEAIADGAKIVPTDKNYKAYLERPEQGRSKFYFGHLDESQKRAFIDLVNAKTLNIGVPGYFYTRPFFMAPA